VEYIADNWARSQAELNRWPHCMFMLFRVHCVYSDQPLWMLNSSVSWLMDLLTAV
jgi:hypothetical protein